LERLRRGFVKELFIGFFFWRRVGGGVLEEESVCRSGFKRVIKNAEGRGLRDRLELLEGESAID
jgi:hypothetical protein